MSPQWNVKCFGSGTVVVVATEPSLPYLYVYGPRVGDSQMDTEEIERISVAARFETAEQLAAYMNGGARPGWMDGLSPIGDEVLTDASGRSIDICGPDADKATSELLRLAMMDLLLYGPCCG